MCNWFRSSFDFSSSTFRIFYSFWSTGADKVMAELNEIVKPNTELALNTHTFKQTNTSTPIPLCLRCFGCGLFLRFLRFYVENDARPLV